MQECVYVVVVYMGPYERNFKRLRKMDMCVYMADMCKEESVYVPLPGMRQLSWEE